MDVGVAGDLADDQTGERHPAEGAAGLLVAQRRLRDHDVEVGTVALAELVGLVVEVEPEDVDHGLALPTGRGLLEITGVGQAETGGDQLGVLGVEGAPEVAAPVEGLDEDGFGAGLFGWLVLVEDGVGLGRRVLHRPGRERQVQRLEQGDQLSFMLRPQPSAAVGDVGHDDLHLPVDEAARQPGVGGGRQVAEPAARLEDPVGGLVRPRFSGHSRHTKIMSHTCPTRFR
ncbi:MAG: hypothetical protein ABIP36_08045 [Acidimicrobiales bacterium]